MAVAVAVHLRGSTVSWFVSTLACHSTRLSTLEQGQLLRVPSRSRLSEVQALPRLLVQMLSINALPPCRLLTRRLDGPTSVRTSARSWREDSRRGGSSDGGGEQVAQADTEGTQPFKVSDRGGCDMPGISV